MSESPKRRKRILLAVGGTGGHLFPAQALAKELSQHEILFAGCLLGTNRYFQKEQFQFTEIRGASPTKGGVGKKLRALIEIGRGMRESLTLLKTFMPDLIIGFGSFHSFPILLAAKLKKIPYILFESNAIPGKVNRFFSKSARTSALQFSDAGHYLQGKTELVKMPLWKVTMTPSKEEALAYFSLEPQRKTLLVFGGSQGADALNHAICKLDLPESFQIIHITGTGAMATFALETYRECGILASVKPFEEKMQLAWAAADLVICRSGGATLAELLSHEVPAILIPWSRAADNHQEKNAKSLASNCSGALVLSEANLDELQAVVERAIPKLAQMKESIAQFNLKEKRQELSKLIQNYL